MAFFLYSVIYSRWIFSPPKCLFFTLRADYDQFWHVSAAFNWLHSPIMSVGPGKSKFWTSHHRFSTRKLPLNIGYFEVFHHIALQLAWSF